METSIRREELKEERSMSQQKSDIARLRARIEREQQAAEWALTGLAAGTLQHRFINRRYRRIDEQYQELSKIIGENQAIELVAKIIEGEK